MTVCCAVCPICFTCPCRCCSTPLGVHSRTPSLLHAVPHCAPWLPPCNTTALMRLPAELCLLCARCVWTHCQVGVNQRTPLQSRLFSNTTQSSCQHLSADIPLYASASAVMTAMDGHAPLRLWCKRLTVCGRKHFCCMRVPNICCVSERPMKMHRATCH